MELVSAGDVIQGEISMRNRRRLFVCLLAVSAVTSSGCGVILPAHRHSNVRDEENVSFRMLTPEQMKDVLEPYDKDNTQRGWDDFRPASVPKAAVPAALVPIAVSAGSALLDYLATEVKEEASLYRATFSDSVACDGFWKKLESEAFAPSYSGFEIVRTVPGASKENTAFHFVCGIRYSGDERMFRMVPLVLKVNKSKAKVLTDEWWSYYTFLWKPLLRTGHEISIEISVRVTAHWVDDKSQLHRDLVAEHSFSVGSYNLNERPALLGGTGTRSLLDGKTGWFGNVPMSAGLAKTVKEAGAFQVELSVTEVDLSNAHKYLTAAAKQLESNKSKILVQIENFLKPAETEEKK